MTTQPQLFPNGDVGDLVRCVSLWQPWASLMACRAKFLETRGWDTKVRGDVYIHASKTHKGIAALDLAPAEVITAMERALGVTRDKWKTELPFGALIAVGNLSRTLTAFDAMKEFPAQRPFGDFTYGRFAHQYDDLRAIKARPTKGAQGFFFAPNPEVVS